MAIKWKSSSSATGENVTSVVYNVNGSSVGTIYRVKKSDVNTTNHYVWAKPYSKYLRNFNSGGTASVSVTAHDEPAQTNGTKGTAPAASGTTEGTVTPSTLYYGDSVTISSTASSYHVRQINLGATPTNAAILTTNAPYSFTFTGGTLPSVTCCFLPDAQVMVSLDGATRNISDIQPGDPVVTYNKLTRELQLTECYQVYTRVVSSMVELAFSDDSSLILTHDHPIYDINLNPYCANGVYGQTFEKEDRSLYDIQVLKGDNTSKLLMGTARLDFEPDITTYDISVLQGSTIIVDGVVCMSAQDSQIENFEDENVIFKNRQILATSGTKASGGGTADPNACTTLCSGRIGETICCASSSRSIGKIVFCCTSSSASDCGASCSGNEAVIFCADCSASKSLSCVDCSATTDSCDAACSTSTSTMFC